MGTNIIRCIHEVYKHVIDTPITKGVLQDVICYTTKTNPNMVKEMVTHFETGDFIKKILYDATGIPNRVVHVATDGEKMIFERASKHGYLVDDLAQQSILKNNELLTLVSDKQFNRLCERL